MAGWRPDRVAEMVHQELAVRLRTEVKDPLLSPISITRVEVSKDLGRALVFFLPLGGGAVSKELREALARAGRQLRGPIGKALRLRIAPDIAFREDVDHERAVRLTHLLGQIGQAAQATPADAASDDVEAPDDVDA